jgi:GAF domain-containing protein
MSQESNTDLERQLAQALYELSEARKQQAATAEVLRIISSSPDELEPVFEVILANATRICGAKFGSMYLREPDGFRIVATHNAPSAYVEMRARELVRPAPDGPLGRAVITKQTVQIADITTTRSYIEQNPFVVAAVDLGGYRTVVSVPMLKANELIGAINGRHPGRAADQVRSHLQSDDGEGARARDPRVVPATRRRGDRVMLFCYGA